MMAAATDVLVDKLIQIPMKLWLQLAGHSTVVKGAVPPEPAVIKRFSRMPQNPPVTRSNLLSAN